MVRICMEEEDRRWVLLILALLVVTGAHHWVAVWIWDWEELILKLDRERETWEMLFIIWKCLAPKREIFCVNNMNRYKIIVSFRKTKSICVPVSLSSSYHFDKIHHHFLSETKSLSLCALSSILCKEVCIASIQQLSEWSLLAIYRSNNWVNHVPLMSLVPSTLWIYSIYMWRLIILMGWGWCQWFQQ